MPVLPQPTPMRASRRGPLHGLPDSNTRSLEGARLQPADLNGESPGVVNFNEQDWSLSNERRQLPCEHRGAAPFTDFRTPTPGAWKGPAYNQRISNGESPGVVNFNEQDWSLSKLWRKFGDAGVV